MHKGKMNSLNFKGVKFEKPGESVLLKEYKKNNTEGEFYYLKSDEVRYGDYPIISFKNPFIDDIKLNDKV